MEVTPDVVLAPAPEAAAGARRHLQRVGRSWPADVLELSLLLTSELVTNAVRYGKGRVTLTVDLTPRRLRIEVGDADTTPLARRPDRDGHGAEGGRGLSILDALASRWGSTVRTEPPGKSVWFELDLPGDALDAVDQRR